MWSVAELKPEFVSQLFNSGKSTVFAVNCSLSLFPNQAFLSERKISSVSAAAAAKSLQSCPTLCDPRDGSPPGSPVPGIFQARTLEWVPFPSPMHESEK